MRTDLIRAMRVSPLFLCVLLACGNQVSRDIKTVARSSSGAAEARQRLRLMDLTDVEPLIAAFLDESNPIEGRRVLGDLMHRLHLRQPDERIEEALIKALDDPQPEMREKAVEALAHVKKRALVQPVLELLDRETDATVQLRILLALEILMDVENAWWRSPVPTHRMTEEQKDHFARRLRRLMHEAKTDSLRFHSRDWLETLLALKASEGNHLAVQANLAQAESTLVAARDSLPDSKHLNFMLGKFYYNYGDEKKGETILHQAGCLLYAPELKVRPTIDGNLDDPGWRGAAFTSEFWENSSRMSAIPSSSETTARLGYSGDTLFVGFSAHEESTANLHAIADTRDGGTWRDDCFEVLIDPERDGRSYMVQINSIGTLGDSYKPPNSWESDQTWDSQVEYAVGMEENYWYLEGGLAGRCH